MTLTPQEGRVVPSLWQQSLAKHRLWGPRVGPTCQWVRGLVFPHQVPRSPWLQVTRRWQLPGTPTFYVSAKCGSQRKPSGECLKELPGESAQRRWWWQDSRRHDSTMQRLEHHPQHHPSRNWGTKHHHHSQDWELHTHVSCQELGLFSVFTGCQDWAQRDGCAVGLTWCGARAQALLTGWMKMLASFLLNFISPLCLRKNILPYSTPFILRSLNVQLHRMKGYRLNKHVALQVERPGLCYGTSAEWAWALWSSISSLVSEEQWYLLGRAAVRGKMPIEPLPMPSTW